MKFDTINTKKIIIAATGTALALSIAFGSVMAIQLHNLKSDMQTIAAVEEGPAITAQAGETIRIDNLTNVQTTANDRLQEEAAKWFTAEELKQLPAADLDIYIAQRKAEFKKYLTETEMGLSAAEKIFLYEQKKQAAENPRIQLNSTDIIINPGEQMTLTAATDPENTQAAFTWTSSDCSVIAVSGKDATATVTAKKNGTATVTVSCGTSTAQCKFTVVSPKQETFSLNHSQVSMYADDYMTLTASSAIADAYSSDRSVVTVRFDGKTATLIPQASGSATITVTGKNGYSAKCRVTVLQDRVCFDRSYMSLTTGQMQDLYILSGSASKWYSENSSIASVYVVGDGSMAQVEAKSAGTTRIIAVDSNGNKAYCTVSVSKTVETLSLSSNSMFLTAGDLANIYVTRGTASQWTSSNESVAYVYPVGDGSMVQIEARSAGTAVINAYSRDNACASCTITVEAAPAPIQEKTCEPLFIDDVPEADPIHLSIAPGAMTMSVNQMEEIRVVEGSAANWSSSNTSVVKVYVLGDGSMAQVEAVGAGTATITATSANGTKSTCTITVSAPQEKVAEPVFAEESNVPQAASFIDEAPEIVSEPVVQEAPVSESTIEAAPEISLEQPAEMADMI